MKTITLSELDAELSRLKEKSQNEAVPPGYKTIAEWSLEWGLTTMGARHRLNEATRLRVMKKVTLRRFQGGATRLVNHYGPTDAPSASTKKALKKAP